MKHASQTIKAGLAALMLLVVQLILPAQAAFATTNPEEFSRGNLKQVFCNIEGNSGKWKAQIGGPGTEHEYPLLVDNNPVYVHDQDDVTSTMDQQCQTLYGRETIPVPLAPAINDPCGTGNATWVVPDDTAMIDWKLHQGKLSATAMPGYVFANGETSVYFGSAKEENKAPCVTKIQKPTVSIDDPCGLNNAEYGYVPYSTKYTYVRNNDGSITFTAKDNYVFDDGSQNGVKTYTLPAPQDSNKLCRVNIPHQPDTDDPCGPANASWDIPQDTYAYTWSISEGHLIATAKANYVFTNGQTVIDFGVAPDSNQPCPVTITQPTCETNGSMTLTLSEPNHGSYYYKVTIGLQTTTYDESEFPVTINGIPQGSTVKVKLIRDGIVFDIVIFEKVYKFDLLNCIAIPDPQPTDPCGVANASWTLPEDTDTVHWSIVNDELIATAVGSLFTDGSATHNYGTAEDSNTLCPPTPPEVIVFCGLYNNDQIVTPEVDENAHYHWVSYWKGDTLVVKAVADDGYMFEEETQTKWRFTDEHTACEMPKLSTTPKTCHADATVSVDYDIERYYYTIQLGDGDELPLDSGTTTLTEVGTYTVRGYERNYSYYERVAIDEQDGLVFTETFTVTAPSCEPGKGSITPLPTPIELPHTGNDGLSNLLIALVSAAAVYGAVYFAQPKRV